MKTLGFAIRHRLTLLSLILCAVSLALWLTQAMAGEWQLVVKFEDALRNRYKMSVEDLEEARERYIAIAQSTTT